MSVATTYASAELGIDAPVVTVEAAISVGLPQTLIVGLPKTAVRESKDRVKAAIVSSGYRYPSDKRLTVNLAPADLPKTSGRYDLAIAVAILAASGEINRESASSTECLGELALTGELRGVRGVLPAALRNRQDGRVMIVPAANAAEASLAQSTRLLSARTLNEVIDHLANDSPLPMASSRPLPPTQHDTPRLSDIKGQAAAKRALLIAASGGHNLLMIGPPGTGKTMLASRLRSLLPDMTLDEALEVASIASVSRQAFDTGRFRERPFRSPHHTATGAAMVGGNSPPRPGEISLAHAGVLFLDELPEYSRQALEALREPLESGEIWISRAAGQVRYPAGFQLVAAMNPCPCGHFGNRLQECECTADQIHRYRSRLSGPLLDRIDLHIEVPPLPPGTLSGGTSRTEDLQCERSHPDMTSVEDDTWQQNRVETTRQRSLARQGTLNVKLDGRQLTRHCRLVDEDSHYLDHAVSSLGISARGYFKILRIARTIADLSDGADINRTHLIEALGFRRLDRLR